MEEHTRCDKSSPLSRAFCVLQSRERASQRAQCEEQWHSAACHSGAQRVCGRSVISAGRGLRGRERRRGPGGGAAKAEWSERCRTAIAERSHAEGQQQPHQGESRCKSKRLQSQSRHRMCICKLRRASRLRASQLSVRRSGWVAARRTSIRGNVNGMPAECRRPPC